MKKILTALFAAMIALTPSFAQTKQEIKAAKKEAKKEAKTAAKQLKKEGYKMLELGDLETQLQNYFTKVKAGCKQLAGTAEKCTTVNLGKVTALNNAINEYATLEGGMVKGRITSNASDVDGVQADNIVAAYERLVLKEVKNEIQTCITLVKTNNLKDNKINYDVRVYCLVDYDAARTAREKAMGLALAELNLSQQYGSKVSDWINEGFDKAEKE